MKRIRWGDILAEVIADWIARVLYFLGTVVILPVAYSLLAGIATNDRSVGTSFYTSSEGVWESRALLFGVLFRIEFWVLVFIFGILAAIFGPGVYRRYRERGLGKLAEIRKNSRTEFDVDVPIAAPAENPRRNDDEHV